MAALAAAGVPSAAKGRIRSPEDAARCLGLGARFVVVGAAITRPDAIARAFADHIGQGAARPVAKGVFR